MKGLFSKNKWSFAVRQVFFPESGDKRGLAEFNMVGRASVPAYGLLSFFNWSGRGGPLHQNYRKGKMFHISQAFPEMNS
jgi:hypothetical protein